MSAFHKSPRRSVRPSRRRGAAPRTRQPGRASERHTVVHEFPTGKRGRRETNLRNFLLSGSSNERRSVIRNPDGSWRPRRTADLEVFIPRSERTEPFMVLIFFSPLLIHSYLAYIVRI